MSDDVYVHMCECVRECVNVDDCMCVTIILLGHHDGTLYHCNALVQF